MPEFCVTQTKVAWVTEYWYVEAETENAALEARKRGEGYCDTTDIGEDLKDQEIEYDVQLAKWQDPTKL